jgi:hypothetical protein
MDGSHWGVGVAGGAVVAGRSPAEALANSVSADRAAGFVCLGAG